jgi:hypothetical protein
MVDGYRMGLNWRKNYSKVFLVGPVLRVLKVLSHEKNFIVFNLLVLAASGCNHRIQFYLFKYDFQTNIKISKISKKPKF